MFWFWYFSIHVVYGLVECDLIPHYIALMEFLLGHTKKFLSVAHNNNCCNMSDNKQVSQTVEEKEGLQYRDE